MFLSAYLTVFVSAIKIIAVIIVVLGAIAVPTGFVLFMLYLLGSGVAKLFKIQTPASFDNMLFGLATIFSILLFTPLGYIAGKNVYGEFFKTERVKISESAALDRYVLVNFVPPIYAYVTLKHERTGEIYESLAVGKHCTGLDKNQLNQPFTLNTQVWYYEDEPTKKFVSFLNLSEAFCNK